MVAIGLALAACGSDDDGTTTGGGDATVPTTVNGDDDGSDGDSDDDGSGGDATSPTSPTTDPVDDGDYDPDGVLRIAKFASYFWDPVTVPSSFAIADLALVYDRLVHTDPDGELIPGLAESWEYSDDGLTLTLSLRPDVQFQDGTMLDADAVKANLDRGISLEGSAVASEFGRVADVVVVDDLTVEIVLSEPDATLPAVLADRAGAMVSVDALDDPELDQNPVGAGMYRLTEFSPGSSFKVERWDGYWDPEAVKLQAIEVTIIPDSTTRVNALTTGQVDIAPIEPFDVGRVESSPDIEVRLSDTMRFVYLTLNRGEAPLDDLRVRQAISHAINREALVDGPWLGFGTPTVQIWPEGFNAHVPELESSTPYDPDLARQLLEEAGYADGFTLDVVVPPQPVSYQQLGEAVQAMLGDVGIEVQLQLTEASALGQVVYVDQVYPAAILYSNGRTDPANTVGDRYTSSGFFNPGGHTTERLEELYLEALQTSDPDVRTGLLQDLSTEIVDNLLEISLFFPQEPEGINDRVVGYVPYISGKPEFRGVGVKAGS